MTFLSQNNKLEKDPLKPRKLSSQRSNLHSKMNPSSSSSPLLPRSNHNVLSQPLRGVASRLLRRASSHRLMLRESSVRVRETAAEEIEERQSEWAYSKPVVVLDVLWNLSFVFVTGLVFGFSCGEKTDVPIRVWIVGYCLQCLFHVGCVLVEYCRRRRQSVVNSNVNEDVSSSQRSSEEVEDGVVDDHVIEDGTSVAKQLESANAIFSFVWWVIGFYWITADSEGLVESSPQLYWLCVAFLAFDVIFVVLCVAVACIIGIAVCCFLPCIIAVLYALADREGASDAEIERLPKFKFVTVRNSEKVNGEIRETSGGIMTQLGVDFPTERVLSSDEAECCICLCDYEDGTELRELSCRHHFHDSCIDKWLRINATCPLCKFNILKTGEQSGDDAV